MKTPAALLAAFAGFALLGEPAQAQYKPTGDDGISVSPRLRAQLDEHKPWSATAIAPASLMHCPKCKNILVSKPVTDSKGLGSRTLMAKGAPMERVVTHGCPGCGTDWAVAGQGKSRQSVPTHKCDHCGSKQLACCNIGGGSAPAKRIERTLVAPH